MDHRFQIDLRGIIDLLSNHLYSGSEVFVRELLQNAVDALRERANLDPEHVGEIVLELHTPRGKPPTLLVTDNGVGLTEEEVHQFLATIGASSKRLGRGGRPEDYLGQFGIGILSCFVVSEEIVVITRSARGGPTLEWRAQPTGQYALRRLEHDVEPGTQVCLTAKAEASDDFTADRLRELCFKFGMLLPWPIRVVHGKSNVVVNAHGAPWRQEFASPAERQRALLDFGRRTFSMPFEEAIPLQSKVGALDGVAFVLPFAAATGRAQTHRVYLKNMLLSEAADNLLPDWAFFVKAVVNANDLRPTASRESFAEDRKLREAREALGACLRRHLVELAEKRPERFERIIQLHSLALKALALEDDECCELFLDWLPFETSLGEMTFGELRQRGTPLRYVATVDGFRQIAKVAAAQGACVINAGYVHDVPLLEKAGELFSDVQTEAIEAADLAQEFAEPDAAVLDAAALLLEVADRALKSFRCQADLRSFQPADVPALYSTSGEGRFLRSVEQSQELADAMWSGVLENLSRSARQRGSVAAQLVFNAENALVRRLLTATDKRLLRAAVEMLYAQALLLGHHPLSGKELKLLTHCTLTLVERALDGEAADG